MLPVQDCTCWSLRMDWSKALQIKLYTVSQTTHSNTVSKPRLEIMLNYTEHCTAGLMEIRPVEPGCVVIRGTATTRFLCIEGGGKLYSSVRIFYWFSVECTSVFSESYHAYCVDLAHYTFSAFVTGEVIAVTQNVTLGDSYSVYCL